MHDVISSATFALLVDERTPARPYDRFASAEGAPNPTEALPFVMHFEAFYLVLPRHRFRVVVAQRLQIPQVLLAFNCSTSP